MLKILWQALHIFLLYMLLSIACFLMLRIIIGYTSFETDVQFLAAKQGYINNPIWMAAFYIHVFSAIIALFAGFTQFSNDFFKRHRPFHRLIGKIYAWNILVINFPVSMILAINANGHLAGQMAFVLLDILWAWFTYKAVKCALNKDFIQHKRYMIRSYALTFSAVTLRSWHFVLLIYFGFQQAELYAIEAWLGFLPNLVIAEIIIRYKSLTGKSPNSNLRAD